MEAVSEGAAAAGGHVIGVTAPAIFPDRSGANRFVAEEQPSATLPLRIARLIEISDAAIVLPGSIGTLTELAVAWNTAFVARFSGGEPYPLVAVGSLWRDVVAHLSALLDTDGSVVTFVDDVDEAVAVVTGRLRSG
jgi:predicted Rossmann-fold nucleotide-binding protein